VDDETQKKNKRLEKKRRLKERFDAEYDDGDATYFDDLKEEMQIQAEVRLLPVRAADTPPLVRRLRLRDGSG
jgi:ribosome biogenesis protein BMS1